MTNTLGEITDMDIDILLSSECFMNDSTSIKKGVTPVNGYTGHGTHRCIILVSGLQVTYIMSGTVH